MEKEKKVILVQEDMVIREILEQFVHSLNYTCTALSSIYEYDVSVHGEEFDVLISDILFEDVGRLDYTEQVKKTIPFKSLLIISQMGQKNVKDAVLRVNEVKGFFVWPLDFTALQNKLLEI